MRVLHLAGSAVDDLYGELSRVYAQDCLTATADPERYEFHVAYVTPDGCWRFPDDLSRTAIAAAAPVAVADAVNRIAALEIDVVVPQMFCRPGMTTYRALFDLLGLPYLGNPAEVMALAADKQQARAVVAAAGVPVPPGEVLRAGEDPTLDPPVVVKPLDADNSLGLSLVREPGQYRSALATAFEHSDRALVETYVELGREVRCGVLVEDGKLICLPLEEYNVSTVDRPIRRHVDKISRAGDGAVHLVAKQQSEAWIVLESDPITQRVWALARVCHTALGCRDYSLFDFRIDPDGRPWFLEAGLYCSFAEQSVVAVMAKASGRSVPALFDRFVQQASARRR